MLADFRRQIIGHFTKVHYWAFAHLRIMVRSSRAHDGRRSSPKYWTLAERFVTIADSRHWATSVKVARCIDHAWAKLLRYQIRTAHLRTCISGKVASALQERLQGSRPLRDRLSYRLHQSSGASTLGQVQQYGLMANQLGRRRTFLFVFRPLAAATAERGTQSHGRISGCVRWWRPCPRPAFGQARRPS